jgi:hypothetical protein
VYNTTGSAVVARNARGNPGPWLIIGMVQYQDQLIETITYPPPTSGGTGSTQTLNEGFDDSGMFIPTSPLAS